MFRALVVLVFLFGCSRQETLDPCMEPVICTQDIRQVYVSVRDASGVAVPLDHFTVSDLQTNTDITPEYSSDDFRTFGAFNTYPLLTDEDHLSLYRGKETPLRFEGFREGVLIVRREFLAGADCCHVQLYGGDPDIVLD